MNDLTWDEDETANTSLRYVILIINLTRISENVEAYARNKEIEGRV
jgi:hypothetical protein